jgi:hypothetical protein
MLIWIFQVKKSAIFSFLLIITQGSEPLFAQSKSSEYAGTWSFEKDVSGQSTPYSTFELDIGVRGNDVSGRYCYITQSGNKIDCEPSDPPNIHGSIGSDGALQVSFNSFSGASGGVATISREGDKLLWKVVKNPLGDGFYGPEQAELSTQRSTSDGADGNDGSSEDIKITSSKAYLFKSPSEQQITKAYLVQGDEVKFVGRSGDKNYIHVNYLSKKAGVLDGWIRCEDASSCN